MRIGFLTTYSQRCGLATYAEQLVPALRAHGAEVAIVAPRLFGDDRDTGMEPVPRLWNRNRAFGIEAIPLLRALPPVDVVHANVNLSLFSSRILFNLGGLARRRGTPFFATWHGRDGGSLGRRFKVWRFHHALRDAHVIVHNESHAAEVRAAGVRRVHVVPHGLPPVEHRDRAAARRALGIPEGKLVFAHFGFLVPDKGVLEMLAAIAALRAQGRDVFYWISGAVYDSSESRAYFARLKQEIARLGLERHVHLDGAFVPHEAAMDALAAADWVVLDYHTGGAQGTSGAVTWALSSGSPVAVSRAPVFDDVRAAVHTLDGPLERALARLVDERELADVVRKRIEAYARAASWTEVAARHLELYRDAVGRN